MMQQKRGKIPGNILIQPGCNKKRFSLYAILIFIAFHNPLPVCAQSKTDSLPASLNVDSLSDDDKILLQLYKDTFDNELYNFLAVFDNKGKLKIDTSVLNMDKSSHVEAGIGFSSRILINGREQGLNGAIFLPSAGYYHKTGLYAQLTLGFYTDPGIARSTVVPVAVLSAGYQHTFFKIWSLGCSYSRTFISYGSVVSRSLLNNTISLNTGVNIWKHFIFEAEFYTVWSSLHNRPAFEERELGLACSLRKDFIIRKFIGAKIFTISPGVTAYFASDNLAFIRQRAVAEQVHNPLSLYTTGIDHFFGFVDIEPSVTFDWRIRNLDISALPGVAIPFNTFDYTSNTRVSNPREYKFYVQAGVKYLFCVKHPLKHKAV